MCVSVYTKSLCHVMEVLSGPLMTMLENRLEINQIRCQQLLKQKQELQQRLAKIS